MIALNDNLKSLAHNLELLERHPAPKPLSQDTDFAKQAKKEAEITRLEQSYNACPDWIQYCSATAEALRFDGEGKSNQLLHPNTETRRLDEFEAEMQILHSDWDTVELPHVEEFDVETGEDIDPTKVGIDDNDEAGKWLRTVETFLVKLDQCETQEAVYNLWNDLIRRRPILDLTMLIEHVNRAFTRTERLEKIEEIKLAFAGCLSKSDVQRVFDTLVMDSDSTVRALVLELKLMDQAFSHVARLSLDPAVFDITDDDESGERTAMVEKLVDELAA